MPESMYRRSVGVGLRHSSRHPVISRQVASWLDPTSSHGWTFPRLGMRILLMIRANAVERSVRRLASHLIPVNLLTMLFLVQTLALVFSMMGLE